MPWTYDLWILQWFGLVIGGAGAVAVGVSLLNRSASRHDVRDVGIAGNLPAAPGINMATIRVGGDWGGLLVVVGVLLAFLPEWWEIYIAVAGCSILLAGILIRWRRRRPV